MAHETDKPIPSCYGCIKLRYRGPHGILDPEEIDQQNSGRYHCVKFDMTIAAGHEIPRPHEKPDSCKERL